MPHIIQFVHQIIQSQHFFLITLGIALSIKLYLLGLLLFKGIRNNPARLSWLLLLGVLIGSIMGDVSWSVKLIRKLFLSSVPYGFYIFLIRLSWAALIIQYQSLALFIESLTKKQYRLHRMHQLLFFISSAFSCYFLYLAFFDTSLTNEQVRNSAFLDTSLPEVPMEVKVMRYVSMYLLPIVIVPSLFFSFKNIKNQRLPKILKQQLSVLIKYMLCPFLFAEFIVAVHLNVQHLHIYESGLLSISSLLISYSIYYCIQKVLGLRFLNISQHLQATQRINFINNFKEILEQLSKVSSDEELAQVTQTFFKEAFDIPHKKLSLFIRDIAIRNKEKGIMTIEKNNQVEKITEDFMAHHTAAVCDLIRTSKILMYDELAFSHFYEDNEERNMIIQFMEKIHADIFLPIYQKQTLIAYIVIDMNARADQLYTSADRDEMIVFANYIGTIVNLLQNRNLSLLIQQEKDLKEEIYFKHQEINQYKESIRSFLRSDNYKDLGILFYKNGHFSFGNQAAQEMIRIDLNTQEGHPLTKTLKEIGHQVEQFKIPKTQLINLEDARMVISGVLNLEKHNVIIIVHPPEISDLVKKQMELLKDPTTWDYLLYLETTQMGHLIAQTIPGSGPILLNAKIDLFKTGLCRKAVSLQVHDDDAITFVQLIHQMSARETLHILTIHEPESDYEYAIKLFGINPIFMSHLQMHEKPLLEKLDPSGTLYIQNIHLLSMETQEYLAEYIRTGIFRTFKSDQKTSSKVRIIVSSSHNLSLLTQEGTFSPALWNELKKGTLDIPSLLTLSETEFDSLVNGFTHQVITNDNFKSILELNEKEKAKLLATRPASLNELKKKVQNTLINKSKKNHIYEDVEFDPATNVSDPDLIQAARLGKYALKDQRTMTMLWNKFKNQNKIASFLGVNRSSVNRRCKAYNLQ